MHFTQRRATGMRSRHAGVAAFVGCPQLHVRTNRHAHSKPSRFRHAQDSVTACFNGLWQVPSPDVQYTAIASSFGTNFFLNDTYRTRT